MIALADTDALLAHAKSFAGGKKGAPKAAGGVSRPGRPFTRAATVMLAGATEAFLESLALETGTHLQLSPNQTKDLKSAVDRMHGIGADKVHGIYAMLGCPFILDDLGWKGLPKGSVRDRLAELHKARNKIAHGSAPASARIVSVQHQRAFVRSLATAMEKATAARIADVTGKQFCW